METGTRLFCVLQVISSCSTNLGDSMHSIINLLVQLQELILIRNEHKVLSEGEHLDRLDDSIDELIDKLPSNIRAIFSRLRKRDHIVLSTVNGSNCSMCGMQLPTSQVQAVRKEEIIQYCPSCARFLFWSERPRWMGERQTRLGPRKIGISRFSHKSLMIPELKATTREKAIEEIVNVMKEHKFVEDQERIVSLALDREAILSTSVDYNIAFPHVRGIEGGGLTLALGISRNGIIWGDNEPDPVHFIFFFAIPTAVSAFYLKLLSGLVETFVQEENRKQLLDAESPEALWKILTRATRYTIK